jgi:WhiB family redox-sensing transcriptional regulator
MKPDRLYEVLKEAIDESQTLPPCQVTDPEIWFADIDVGFNHARLAKQFCDTCPVKKQCADYAIAAVESHGIWGGTTPRERMSARKLIDNPGRGRPRLKKEKTPTA